MAYLIAQDFGVVISCSHCPADPWTPDVLVVTGIVREMAGGPQEDFKQDSILQQLPDSSPFKTLSHGHALA